MNPKLEQTINELLEFNTGSSVVCGEYHTAVILPGKPLRIFNNLSGMRVTLPVDLIALQVAAHPCEGEWLAALGHGKGAVHFVLEGNFFGLLPLRLFDARFVTFDATGDLAAAANAEGYLSVWDLQGPEPVEVSYVQLVDTGSDVVGVKFESNGGLKVLTELGRKISIPLQPSR